MREFAYHRTTTNLRNHLQRFHSDQYKTVDSRQTKLLSISKKCSKSQADNIDQLLVSVIVKDIRPIRIVEGEGMKALLQYLEPVYEPSRKCIMKLLHARYEKAIPILKVVVIPKNMTDIPQGSYKRKLSEDGLADHMQFEKGDSAATIVSKIIQLFPTLSSGHPISSHLRS